MEGPDGLLELISEEAMKVRLLTLAGLAIGSMTGQTPYLLAL